MAKLSEQVKDYKKMGMTVSKGYNPEKQAKSIKKSKSDEEKRHKEHQAYLVREKAGKLIKKDFMSEKRWEEYKKNRKKK